MRRTAAAIENVRAESIVSAKLPPRFGLLVSRPLSKTSSAVISLTPPKLHRT